MRNIGKNNIEFRTAQTWRRTPFGDNQRFVCYAGTLNRSPHTAQSAADFRSVHEEGFGYLLAVLVESMCVGGRCANECATRVVTNICCGCCCCCCCSSSLRPFVVAFNFLLIDDQGRNALNSMLAVQQSHVGGRDKLFQHLFTQTNRAYERWRPHVDVVVVVVFVATSSFPFRCGRFH